jgi:membrane-bound serine protease (ClpP class)
MRTHGGILWILFLALGVWIAPFGVGGEAHSAGGAPARTVYVLDVEGSINPALADYILKGIEKAEEKNAAAVIVRMDTPGGVVSTTKTIIKNIMSSKVPVAVYVAPSGSSATSAGALIAVCADIAAMAPGTNIGAAHPVGGGGEDIGGAMSEKVLNDLTAYVRSIVRERGRNADWAEKAIRQSVSVTAKEALEIKAIDIVAESLPDLLNQMDGREIRKKDRILTAATKGAKVERVLPGLRFKILDVVANPNIAYLLMMIGGFGIMMELYHPGMVFPGVLGGICLLLAFFALQVLPVNYVGIMLIMLSVVLFVLELKVTSFGLLSIAGVACLTMGSVMLFETGEQALRVSLSVILPTVATLAGGFLLVASLALRAMMRKPRTGGEGLIGEVGEAITDIRESGKVFVHGEYWNAFSSGSIARGDKVRVIHVRGLSVEVVKA